MGKGMGHRNSAQANTAHARHRPRSAPHMHDTGQGPHLTCTTQAQVGYAFLVRPTKPDNLQTSPGLVPEPATTPA